jgi:hypothetical protein
VLRIVVSNDSMKNATATSHGRRRALVGFRSEVRSEFDAMESTPELLLDESGGAMGGEELMGVRCV